MAISKSKQDERTFSSRLPNDTIRLSSIERRVLSAIQFDGRLSVPEVARLIDSKESAVRYAVDSLKEKQVIYFAPLIDLSLLGYTYYTLVVSMSSQGSQQLDKVRQFIVSAPRVIFAREIGGEHHFAITFVARSAAELDRFCRDFEKQIGENIQDKQLAVHLKMAVFRADYLFTQTHGERMFSWGQAGGVEQFDPIDHVILRGICAPTFSSIKELARTSGVPVSTLEYRLKRLEQKGVIVCYRNIIRAVKFGVHRFWVTIQTTEASDALTEKFFKYCSSNPYVRHATKAIGPWDFDLGFDAPDATTALAVREGITDAFGKKLVRMTTTNIFHSSRIANYPFLQYPDQSSEVVSTGKASNSTRGIAA